MKPKAIDERQLIGYLLGELPEEDQTLVEEQFLRDPEYFEHLQAVEEELNDAYVRGELSGPEREQFERRVSASPEWKQRVEFARALYAVGRERPAEVRPEPTSWWRSLTAFFSSQSPAFKLASAAAAIAILAAGSWLILEMFRLRAQVEQLQAERQQMEQNQQQLQQQSNEERERAQQLAQELEREREQKRKPESEPEEPRGLSIASFILMPGIGRGDEQSTELVIPKEAQVASFQLYLQGPTPYKSYRAELVSAGKLIWSRDGLTARQARNGKAVSLNLPASAFTSGKYELALKGVTSDKQIEDVSFYYFSVVKK
jgi:anti-sigma factor RsiW